MQEVQDEGLTVSFLVEASLDFYVHPDVDDISFPVYPEETVVLEPPKSQSMHRKFGYKFSGGVKSAVLSFLNKKSQ